MSSAGYTGCDTVDGQILDALMSKRKVSDDVVDGGWKRYLGGQ